MPVYLDRSKHVDGKERGVVLRAGCERARIVLERLRKSQRGPSNLENAIGWICKLQRLGPSFGSIVKMPAGDSMSPEAWCRMVRSATQAFDTPPSERFSQEAINVLHEHGDLVVHGASYGVYKVLDYWKSPEREKVWDKQLQKGLKVHLQDCCHPTS
jgi:hypothetical protein